MKQKDVIKYNKNFAKGDQNKIIINNKIISIEDKKYYWERKDIFNILLPVAIEMKMKYNLSDQELYGFEGPIDLLRPIQQRYNEIKNLKYEVLDKIRYNNLFIEDGSVDIDNLEEEGIGPGKILIYRQGSKIPQIISPNYEIINNIEKEEKNILMHFKKFVKMIKQKYNKNQR